MTIRRAALEGLRGGVGATKNPVLHGGRVAEVTQGNVWVNNYSREIERNKKDGKEKGDGA